MNVCKVLQLPQWCTYHAEGDSQRQSHNGPHNTRPFDVKAESNAATKPATNADPPAADESATAPSDPKHSPRPSGPKDAAPEQPAKDSAAKDAAASGNGGSHRGKRKLADQPAGAPAANTRRVVAEPSPEPEAAKGGRGNSKAKATAGTNGSAAGANGAVSAAGGDAAGSDDGSEREGSPMVFLCRHAYDAKRHKWVDEEVPLYCVCCMPYNPDLDMVECARCGEWYVSDVRLSRRSSRVSAV